ncbi:hypothetical protein ACIQU5_36160 [Streptomyces sp. NPDC090306]|uniref:hypothetical protein n=1 Tax=Streptomyces sp. NPDC090306 TaxID=3365961 RepID=UPI0037F804EF
MNTHLLHELFRPGQYPTGRRPWISGTLSASAQRTSDVTGTAGCFRTFPGFVDATMAACP